MSARLAGFAVGSLLFSASVLARAEPMDPAIERLILDGNCFSGDGAARINPAAGACKPDNRSFKRLVNQLGFALAPTAMHSARTTGYGGFNVAIEASYTKISSGADYWKRGTEGPVDPSTNHPSTYNESPVSLIQQYSLVLRKGFGFGLEVAGVVGFMPKSSILNGGADVRLALLEGFRTGVLGIFPDVAVGGGVRTITGTPELQLTTVGLDVQVSKPLPIQDSSVLTPWIGYQYLWIFGDSGLVDLTPGTDAQGYCNYAGSNVPGSKDPNKSYYDGQPVCKAGAGSAADFNNNTVFAPVRVHRQRLMFGANYRYEMVTGGAQFITDIVSPSDANSGANKSDLKGEARQWTLVLQLGAHF